MVDLTIEARSDQNSSRASSTRQRSAPSAARSDSSTVQASQTEDNSELVKVTNEFLNSLSATLTGSSSVPRTQGNSEVEECEVVNMPDSKRSESRSQRGEKSKESNDDSRSTGVAGISRLDINDQVERETRPSTSRHDPFKDPKPGTSKQKEVRFESEGGVLRSGIVVGERASAGNSRDQRPTGSSSGPATRARRGASSAPRQGTGRGATSQAGRGARGSGGRGRRGGQEFRVSAEDIQRELTNRPSLATHLLNTEEALKQERVRELVQRLVESIRHRREREEAEMDPELSPLSDRERDK